MVPQKEMKNRTNCYLLAIRMKNNRKEVSLMWANLFLYVRAHDKILAKCYFLPKIV